MIRLCLIYAILIGLALYLTESVFSALKSGKVQHKSYFLESGKKRDFDVAKIHPVQYWLTVVINFIFLVFVVWIGITQSF